jgi:hypothetical protein
VERGEYDEVKSKFDATGKDMKRDGGIDILAPGHNEAAKNLFERLSEYGLFVVPRGEIESWLPALGAQGLALLLESYWVGHFFPHV